MTGRTYLLLGVCVMSLATVAGAQPVGPGVAKAPPAPTDFDKIAVDVLKDIHNRGAELYNKGEPLGSLRLYEGSLLTVRPFLAHRPAIQKLIDDGLNEVAKTDGIKIQAFRLHEVIEEVRGKLKEEIKKGEPKTTDLKPPKDPMTPPKVETPGDAKVTGKVTLLGKPVGGAEVVFVSLSAAEPKVYRATTGEDGTYTLTGSLAPGNYAVKVTAGEKGPKLPEKFMEFTTSGLKLKVATGMNTLDLNLQ